MDGKQRFLAEKVNKLLTRFPAVAILGARQCGKSTLAQQLRPDWRYLDLENPNDHQFVTDDPVLFFRQHKSELIFDEAQRSPKLFEILRGVIDADRKQMGRFIITGSAHYELLKQISESLAGRIAIVELSPFKMDEALGRPLSPFFSIFSNPLIGTTPDAVLESLSNIDPDRKKTDQTIQQFMLSGGYPEPALSSDRDFQLDWYENYFSTYINRDMRTLFPRLDFVRYRRVVAMLSSLSGTIVNRSEVARSVEASEKSIRDYLEIISGTYFWRSLPAFQTKKIKTTTKLPKGHFQDSGLTLFLQNILDTDMLARYPRVGHLFEAFAAEEVIRGIAASDARNLHLSHFRTKAGAEIDLIVEGTFGILPIEIKYQSHTRPKQIRSLHEFVLTHELPFGVVINMSETPGFITDRIISIPINSL